MEHCNGGLHVDISNHGESECILSFAINAIFIENRLNGRKDGSIISRHLYFAKNAAMKKICNENSLKSIASQKLSFRKPEEICIALKPPLEGLWDVWSEINRMKPLHYVGIEKLRLPKTEIHSNTSSTFSRAKCNNWSIPISVEESGGVMHAE